MSKLDYENKFVRTINVLVDLLILGAITFLGSMTIIFLIPCWAALYYTINKSINHSRGYVFNEYFGFLVKNLKQTIPCGLTWAGIMAFLILDLKITSEWIDTATNGLQYFNIFFIVMLVVMIGWGIFLMSYLARFEGGYKEVMKNTVAIAFANLGWMVLFSIVLGGIVLFFRTAPMGLMLMPGFYVYAVVFKMEKIFKKYRTEEDIAKEEEQNREYFN